MHAYASKLCSYAGLHIQFHATAPVLGDKLSLLHKGH